MDQNIFNQILSYDKLNNIDTKKKLKKKIKTLFKSNNILFNKIMLLNTTDRKILIKHTIKYINDPKNINELDNILQKLNISNNEYKQLINDYLNNNYNISIFINIFVSLFIILFLIKYIYEYQYE